MLHVGVKEVIRETGLDKWNSSKIGIVDWDPDFDTHSFEGENKVKKLCDDLRVFDQIAKTDDFKTEKEVKPVKTSHDISDACACKGAKNLPTDYFKQEGYSVDYGSSCTSWDY